MSKPTDGIGDDLRFLAFSLDKAPDAVFWMNSDAGFSYVNEQACRSLGYTREELLQLKLWDIDPVYPKERWDANWEQFQRDGEVTAQQIETWHRRKDGSQFPVEVAARHIRIGESDFHVAFVRDRTERLKTDEHILQVTQDWEDAFDAITDMITIHDTEYNIIRSNKAAREILGLPLLECEGAKCHAYFHGSGLPPDRCPSCECLKTGEPTVTEFFEPHLNRHLEVRAIPRFDRDQNLVGLIHVVRDISRDKKEEAERKQLEAQLRHAQKMEAIGLLAGGVAHDFNNILSVIVGYGNLLRGRVEENEQLRLFTDQILDAAERATRLTHDILSFSRKRILHPRPVDLNEIIGRAEKFLVRLIGEDIYLKAVLGGADLTVLADSSQIEQILMNFATNARDAMPDGGSLVIETSKVVLDEQFAKTHAFGEPGAYALISVSDTGRGFDDEARDRLFEPFFTTKELGKGTGLGLSIIYGIVQQHNGHIIVFSEPGKGTTFNIYLPLLSEPYEEPQEPQADSAPQGGSETLLLAEDDPAVRGIEKIILEKHGYTVLEAGDGDEAVRVFIENRDRIRLLLVDLVMPGRNGREVVLDIRRIDPSMKVVYMSGYTADSIHKRGVAENEADFLAKPVAPAALLTKVREILDRV